MECAILASGEMAVCRQHLVEHLAVTESRLRTFERWGEVSPVDHADATRVDCDRRWRTTCLVPLGQVLLIEGNRTNRVETCIHT